MANAAEDRQKSTEASFEVKASFQKMAATCDQMLETIESLRRDMEKIGK